ncbi:MAG: sodium-dependent transporter, partial [Gammaproteobacteria bacterium]|nr:sodium-dependent transporter [Gammaproteobacteria bacterium]
MSHAATQEQWSSRRGFLLSAIGFSVGLGNIWRFPYVVGENGGSAFVIIYLLCAFAIGLPLLVSELAIGRLGRLDPAGSYRAVATNAGRSMAWGLVGTLAIACVFAVLSFYTVISGWTFDYFVRAVNGSFDGIDAESSTAMFAGLMNNPWRLLFWHTVVNLLVIVIIRRGVQEGVERAAKILMPILFGALIVMVIYSAFAGDLASATKFLLEPDFSKVTAKTVMIAVGQAFFSVGVAMATMITFGAYLPEDFSIPKSSVIIILADTGVAMLAGFVIFPLVFEFGLAPSEGAGLVFQTLPIAFGQMPGGLIFGAVLFLLLIVAALSSCLGGAEAVVSWVDTRWNIPRQKGILYFVGTIWLIGITTIMSLGEWSDFYPLSFIPALAQETIFDVLEWLAANILLLIGAALTSIF